MAQVTLKGSPVSLRGEIPQPGGEAPEFRFVNKDLSEGSLYSLGNAVKIIIAVPSLDTRVCAVETKKFNEELSRIEKVHGLVVSMDLPYAIRRFCEVENIGNVTGVSDFRYREFIQRYNTEIMDGKMKGLSARAVFVVDRENRVRYNELVPEISQEPDYRKALEIIHLIS
jgi:thiol peroxidase